MSISNDQLAAVLAALAPDKATQIREAFGISAMDPTKVPGKVFVNAREAKRYSPALIKLAEHACPQWCSPSFRPKQWLESAEVAVKQLREANSELALAFLLRKGVQTLANDWYIAYPRDWQDYALAAPSNAYAEWYAPLYGSQIAGRVPRGDRFPEGRIQGEDSVLVNQKFGLIEAFERELFDDDMTGQIRQRAQRLGQSMAQTENIYAAFRFIGVAQSYQNLSVPRSGYSTSDVNGNAVLAPFSPTLYGAYGNMPAVFTTLNLNALKRAHASIIVAKDPFSNKIVVTPNTLMHSANDALHAPLLVQPPAGVPYYPAVLGPAGSTEATSPSGFPGGLMGANPFMGIGIKPVLVRYLPDWAWALGEKAKGFVFQERDPLEVIQENPLSGQAFEEDAYRFRSRRRFEADWVGGGSRFWFLGNPGVTDTGAAILAGSTSAAGVAGTF
jgi:hypothetical protein